MAPLLFLLFLLSEAASEPEVIRVVQVKHGQDVILPCRAGDVTILAADWIRSKPEPSKNILFWRDGHSDTPFKDRVQLVDGELKTGDVSMILKDVKREDSGTYECRVITAGSRRKKRAKIKTDPISIVELQVTDPEDQKGDNKDGHNGDTDNGNSPRLYVGLAAVVVVFLLVLAAVGLFLVRKCKRPREKKPEPSAAEETGDNLL
ncbi:uncharacterized protein AB9X84_015095 [Acanthopagrus schlegelii]